MNNSGIYTITNINNNKIYIGSAVHLIKRRCNHLSDLRNNKHSNPHLQYAYNKYGDGAFKFKIEFFCLPKDLIENEQMVIDIYSKLVGWNNIYNIMPIAGSHLGFRYTEESKAKMANAKLGKKRGRRDPLIVAKIAESNRGRKNTAEAKSKMSKAKKGRPWSKIKRETYDRKWGTR